MALPTNLGPPKRLDLRIVRGDAFSRPITLTISGATVDLTGYEGRAQIRDKVNGAIKASFTFTYTDLANGAFEISLTTTDTRNLSATGVWDLELFLTASPTTSNKTIITGSVVVEDDVSRAPNP